MASWVNERPTTLAPSPGILISRWRCRRIVNDRRQYDSTQSIIRAKSKREVPAADIHLYGGRGRLKLRCRPQRTTRKSSICSTASRRLNIDFALKNTRV
ncbi:hypothetical protein MGG_16626 [Pyricularia oryzae 70-15]|uniref:Uncharacterized protein n=1 Tax=Pyricularia oryzae (strain 70-15 / ATCC MYA-4617 / FGSC 8958) TaxID=242507 RepID=G4N0S6_PYRO7|nr:uncharacterized protein MGG_16626 [Pyricularia oryzae 70-15]EHA51509.1 hypothetical protein MGG_16626 [Pyricularia oryzae 70-15]